MKLSVTDIKVSLLTYWALTETQPERKRFLFERIRFFTKLDVQQRNTYFEIKAHLKTRYS